MSVPNNLTQWSNYVQDASAQTGLPTALIYADMQAESNGNPNAVSNTGAIGLMQIEPFWAPTYNVTQSQLYDPATNILVGAKILKYYIDQANGDIVNGLKMYNGGPGGMNLPGPISYANSVFQQFMAWGGNAMQNGVVQWITNMPATIIAAMKNFYSAEITQGYGPTNLSLEPAYDGYPHFHQGIDLNIPSGTAIPVVAPGTVSTVVTGCNTGDMSCGHGYGNQVWVTLSNGTQLLYGHMQNVNVSQGQTVGAGDIIGLSNNTGASTGPHVHFAMMDSSGNWVDPTPYVQAAGNADMGGLSKLWSGITGAAGSAAGAVGDAAGAVGNVASSAGSDIASLASDLKGLPVLLGDIGNAFSYVTDSSKRPVLIFLIFGAFLAFDGIKNMAGQSQTVTNVTQPVRNIPKHVAKAAKIAKTVSEVAG